MQASNFDLQAYFRRIGFSAGDSAQANAATLHALMRQQLFSVPFENLDVQAGKIVSLVPEDIAGKILGGARGGYCYEVNGLDRKSTRLNSSHLVISYAVFCL